MKTPSLNGSWQVRQLDTYPTLPATVFGCVHIDLLNVGKIPPNLLSLLEINDGKQIEIHVSNTTFQDDNFIIKWHICDLQGNSVDDGEIQCHSVAQTDPNVLTLDCQRNLEALGERKFIFYASLEKDGIPVSFNYCTFDRPKHLDLRRPTSCREVTQNNDTAFDIQVKTSRPTLFTHLELAETDARFSDNFFFLPANATVNLTVAPKKQLTLEEVQRQQTHSLHDSYAH